MGGTDNLFAGGVGIATAVQDYLGEYIKSQIRIKERRQEKLDDIDAYKLKQPLELTAEVAKRKAVHEVDLPYEQKKIEMLKKQDEFDKSNPNVLLTPSEISQLSGAKYGMRRGEAFGLSPNKQVTGDITVGRRGRQFSLNRLTKLGEALDASKTVRTAFGVNGLGVNRTERLINLANRYTKAGGGTNLDPREMEELAIGLNAILSGSNYGAQRQVQALVPKTAIGDANKLLEWIGNNPRGTGQQSFVARMLNDTSRERDTMKKQIKRDQFSRMGEFSDVEDTLPGKWKNLIRGFGINENEYHDWVDKGQPGMSGILYSSDPSKLGGPFNIKSDPLDIKPPSVDINNTSAWTPEKESRYQELFKKMQTKQIQ